MCVQHMQINIIIIYYVCIYIIYVCVCCAIYCILPSVLHSDLFQYDNYTTPGLCSRYTHMHPSALTYVFTASIHEHMSHMPIQLYKVNAYVPEYVYMYKCTACDHEHQPYQCIFISL